MSLIVVGERARQRFEMAGNQPSIRAYVGAGRSTQCRHSSIHPYTARAAMLNRLTDALDFQAQALNLRSERQRLIASNIANADTPGYVARDMNFSQALRQATGSGAPAAMLAASQPGHHEQRRGRRRQLQHAE